MLMLVAVPAYTCNSWGFAAGITSTEFDNYFEVLY